MLFIRLHLKNFFFFLCCLSWSFAASAVSLGSPKLLSHPGEPLRVQSPIRLSPVDNADLDTLKAAMPSRDVYERLGISPKILEFNAQSMVYRNSNDQLMVLLETVTPVPAQGDPFVDVLVNLTWSSGSITKTFTLLVGDAQSLLVRPGQTLSEIAAQMTPQYEGASLDQTMLALYKANPDAFASGSINQLPAGTELNMPSQALLRSIDPSEANQFAIHANQEWQASHHENTEVNGHEALSAGKNLEQPARDRLKIGSSAEGDAQEKRYTEELVAQEKELEQAQAKVAQLEKNIAEMQALIDQAKGKKQTGAGLTLGMLGPALLAIGLIALTSLLLWLLARHARRSEVFVASITRSEGSGLHALSEQQPIPERAKALLAGIDLDLPKSTVNPSKILQTNHPLADTLRVKLNLARAYITIEDFSAAKRCLNEVVEMGNAVDPMLTIEAQALIAELTHRNI